MNEMTQLNLDAAHRALLDWYDLNGRDLPWRYPAPDPYHVALSEFMLQQTTVKAVIPYYHEFLRRWPSVGDLARAERVDILAAWAGLGYYNRAKNLHLMAQRVAEMGAFPQNAAALKSLPGIGDYTAAAIAAIAFGEAILPLDGNIKRLLSRLFRIDAVIDRPSPALSAAQSAWSRSQRAADTPQAMMDLANAICRPKNPQCAICPLASNCHGAQNGDALAFPKRAAKRARKNWRAHIFIIDTPQGIGLIRRPEQMVLGGMRALPSSDWSEAVAFEPPYAANWRRLGEIQHIFTHISLRADIWYNDTPAPQMHNQLEFVQNPGGKLPSLWRKALALIPARGAIEIVN